MIAEDIISKRITNQQLTQTKFTTPSDLIAWFGAIQAQDYSSAKWAIGQRIKNTIDEKIENAFNNGEIVRTHVMRPTWHFVHPQDVRWMLCLTAPQVKAAMTYYNRILGFDEGVFKKSQKIFIKALRNGKTLTRSELQNFLKKDGIDTTGQGLAHLVMEAELDAIICSGPRRGKQFTYVLLDEKVPKSKMLQKDEAIAELTKRYFQSHGPATLKDFVWWSGLTIFDAKKGIFLNKPSLLLEEIAGKVYYFFSTDTFSIKDTAYLLPNYDEYIIGYTERELFFHLKDSQLLPPIGQATPFSHLIVFEGQVMGIWRKIVRKDSIELHTKFFSTSSQKQRYFLSQTVHKYSEFLQKKIEVDNL